MGQSYIIFPYVLGIAFIIKSHLLLLVFMEMVPGEMTDLRICIFEKSRVCPIVIIVCFMGTFLILTSFKLFLI